MKLLKQIQPAALFSFSSVYIIWGSTYLAIRYAISSIPPWTLSAARFFLAFLIMAFISRQRREAKLSKQEKSIALQSGVLMIVANGIVCVVEKLIPTGMVAVIVGAMPIWIMLVGVIIFKNKAPSYFKILGAIVGMAGVFLITSQDPSFHADWTNNVLTGLLWMVLSGLLWATGTLMQRQVKSLQSPFAFSRSQMLAGSLATLALAFILEKPWTLQVSSVSSLSIYSLLYLVIFGSVISYTSYSYLSRNFEPAVVGSYALVNPIIAVLLGWAFLSEKLSSAFWLATTLVLVGLSIILFESMFKMLCRRLLKQVDPVKDPIVNKNSQKI